MTTPAERIKNTLHQSRKRGVYSHSKVKLSDAQARQKAKDIRVFFDGLAIKVESKVDEIIFCLEFGEAVLIDEMDKLITLFNHVTTINDAHNIYSPQHNFKDNMQTIKRFVSFHYDLEKLDRLCRALNSHDS